MTETQQVKKLRLQYVDIARGIAMICIILGHLGNPSINRVVFTFHVPIFFFITGYFTSTKRSLPEFTKNKARTLLVPYAMACLVIIILGTLLGLHYGNAADAFKGWIYASIYGAGDSYTVPFYIKGIGAIWFLWATFWGSVFLRISLDFNKYTRVFSIFALFALGCYTRRLFWFPLSIQAGACATLFMYMGYLLRQNKDTLLAIPKEAKAFSTVLAFVTWFSFMKNFQSFWLVHCDIGRGMVDVLGCICACACVIMISKFIDDRMSFIGRPLACFGRYSLLVLCVHIIELDLFPWWHVAWKLVQHGVLPANYISQLLFIIAGKLVIDLGLAFILSRIPLARKAFGFRN